jgi:hypothetical protein
MAMPSLLVRSPGSQVFLAEPGRDERQPPERAFQGSNPAALITWFDGTFRHHSQYVQDELAASFQERRPVILIGVHNRLVLVQQPVNSLGEYVTQFLGPRPVGVPERIIRILDNLPRNRSRLQTLVTVQQKEPVFIVNIGKERITALSLDGEGSPADEGLLLTASVAVCMTDNRIVREADIFQANRIIDIQEAAGLSYVIVLQASHVVVEEKDPGPAEHMAEHERQVALGTGVSPARKDRSGQLAGGLPIGQAEPRWLWHVNGDQVDAGWYASCRTGG